MTSIQFESDDTPLTVQWSEQQLAAFRWVEKGTGSALMKAVAGAGKSTALVEMVTRMKGSVALLAFNKSAGDELGAKLEAKGIERWGSVRSGTFHSFGFSAWRKAAGVDKDLKVDDKKVLKLCQLEDENLKGTGIPRVAEHLQKFVCQAVSLAKQRAFGVLVNMNDKQSWMDLVAHFDLEELLSEDGSELPQETLDAMVLEGIRWALRIFRESVKQDYTVIDYDDMILAPLIHNVRMWKNDWVLIDEAQDTNPARRALAKKMLLPGGRLVAVGDPHQAIYGFTGADNDALDTIKREFSCVELPLTITYRCPKSVVALARTWVDHITAADSAPEGSVETMPEAMFNALPAEAFPATDAMLCRNTKPLVEYAFGFIRKGIPCHVEGKDIGRGLMALATRWKSVKTLDALSKRLEQYREKQVQKMLAKGQEQNAASLSDRVDTLLIIISSCDSGAGIAGLRAKVDSLFGDTPDGETPKNFTLSTVHKSKGREWPRVYLLGRNRYMPSPFARQEWQMAQEKNLMYVAVTRAKSALVEIVVPLPAKKQPR